jgi:hypothetical protein
VVLVPTEDTIAGPNGQREEHKAIAKIHAAAQVARWEGLGLPPAPSVVSDGAFHVYCWRPGGGGGGSCRQAAGGAGDGNNFTTTLFAGAALDPPTVAGVLYRGGSTTFTMIGHQRARFTRSGLFLGGMAWACVHPLCASAELSRVSS